MGRLGTLVPRLVALTAVGLFATTALTYAAAQRISTAPRPATAATTAAAAAPTVKVVPDVRRQPFVFAKATLGDGGFSWRVRGAVRGFASNLVATQSPAPGMRLVDTGAPLIVLRLTRGSGSELGIPDSASDIEPTAVRRAELASAAAPPRAAGKPRTTAKPHATAKPRTTAPAPSRKPPAARKTASATAKAEPKQKPTTRRQAIRTRRWPRNRPPLFTVPGARREPVTEMPLAVRAKLLLDWLRTDPAPTDANVRRWLYQHAWIVAGARMGWWQGDAALRSLVAADDRVWTSWGIGTRSGRIARAALAEVDAHTK